MIYDSMTFSEMKEIFEIENYDYSLKSWITVMRFCDAAKWGTLNIGLNKISTGNKSVLG